MSQDDPGEKLALLHEIRAEVRALRRGVHQGLDRLRTDIHGTLRNVDGGFGRVEVALAEYAEQVRLMVHFTKVLARQRGVAIERA